MEMEGAMAMAPCPFPSITIVCNMVGWSQMLGASRLSLPSWLPSLLPGWARPEGEGGHHGDGTLPNPIDRDCMQFGVGGRGVVTAMVNPSPSHLPIAGLCSHAPSLIPSRSQLIWVAGDENEQRTLAEEEESSGAEEALSCLHHMCYRIVDSDVDKRTSKSGGTGSGNGPPEIWS